MSVKVQVDADIEIGDFVRACEKHAVDIQQLRDEVFDGMSLNTIITERLLTVREVADALQIAFTDDSLVFLVNMLIEEHVFVRNSVREKLGPTDVSHRNAVKEELTKIDAAAMTIIGVVDSAKGAMDGD
jgi:hypothetical protein